MAKTASMRDIEHAIETLPQADQLKLLEKLVQHLKITLLGNKTAVSAVVPLTQPVSTLRSALRLYGNPAQRDNEGTAFAKAMTEKHAHR
ncbi:MAG TPA: hypothetical protein HPP76_04075 [Desulfuromonadales bacterium]|nr:hypothetical protein [Desulfuromonadales bacterium]